MEYAYSAKKSEGNIMKNKIIFRIEFSVKKIYNRWCTGRESSNVAKMQMEEQRIQK